MECLLPLILVTCFAASTTTFHINTEFEPNFPTLGSFFNQGSRTLKLSRATRASDEGYAKFDEERCCNTSEVSSDSTLTKQEEKNTDDCVKEVQDKFGASVTMAYIIKHVFSNESDCFTQCVFRKNNVLDDNGAVIASAATKYLLQWFGEKDEATQEKISNICSKRKSGKSPEEGIACNREALRFTICVFDLTNLYCTAENQITSEECNKVRERVGKQYA
ncbi:uncharacterized protein [Periplaneta americana]|uniref:uncharacterized protein n=1 Tax=Periplaneta americana TaxID=6978 RepID=UPI0037E8F9E8